MKEPSPMHVVAGAFPDSQAADAASRELGSVFELEPDDVSVAALGAEDGSTAVLAARIREHRLRDATEVVRRYGGRIVTDVPEEWTGQS